MKNAFLGLGSNVDARRHIKIAVHALIRSFGDAEISPIYQSRSVGFEGEDFINLVARIQTELKPMELRHYLRRLEDSHGRNRKKPKWSDRTLDIDILLYGDLVTDDEKLKLPRPEILHFAHVLKPLADIAPDLIHPLAGQSYAELWEKGDWEEGCLQLMDNSFLDLRLKRVKNNAE